MKSTGRCPAHLSDNAVRYSSVRVVNRFYSVGPPRPVVVRDVVDRAVVNLVDANGRCKYHINSVSNRSARVCVLDVVDDGVQDANAASVDLNRPNAISVGNVVQQQPLVDVLAVSVRAASVVVETPVRRTESSLVDFQPFSHEVGNQNVDLPRSRGDDPCPGTSRSVVTLPGCNRKSYIIRVRVVDRYGFIERRIVVTLASLRTRPQRSFPRSNRRVIATGCSNRCHLARLSRNRAKIAGVSQTVEADEIAFVLDPFDQA